MRKFPSKEDLFKPLLKQNKRRTSKAVKTSGEDDKDLESDKPVADKEDRE